MADCPMADNCEIFTNERRPVHLANMEDKIACPHASCKEKDIFFKKHGLPHHYRLRHPDVEFLQEIEEAACARMKRLHGQETRQLIEKMFETRSQQVSSDEKIFSAGIGDDRLRIVAKRPNEAAKTFGMYLFHAGLLFDYSKGNKPVVITVSTSGLLVKFKSWHRSREFPDLGGSGTVIVVEPCFVKKEMDSIITPLQEIPGAMKPTSTIEGVTSEMGDEAFDTLKQVFRYNQFKGKQQEAVNVILQQKDCVILMPTGGGKTVCYAVPGIIMSGVTIVVTPLIALILDQVQRLRSVRLNVCYLTSNMKDEEWSMVCHELSIPCPSYKFLFTTPETILTQRVKNLIQTMSDNHTLAQFVVDEANCIDQWGFNFRPSYSSLGALKDYGVSIAALTGTATKRTVEVITTQLRMDDPVIVEQSFLRTNLHYSVVPKKSSAKADVAKLIQDHFPNLCGIVYCPERSDTIEMAYTLNTKGINATYFHGALDPFEKKENSSAWLEGRALVICATSAFGMGIDKPNVRFVVHLTIPKSPEEYYQEVGRAGRDSAQSSCVIFFKFEDRAKQLRMIATLADNDNKGLAMTMHCISNGCRTKQLLQYFGENIPECNNCDACQKADHRASSDASEDGRNIIRCVEDMLKMDHRVTFKAVVLTFLGSKRKEIASKRFNELQYIGYGKGKFSFLSASKFVQLLIVRNVLKENIPSSTEVTTNATISIGDKASALLNGEISVKKS